MKMKKLICLIAGLLMAVSLVSCKNQSTESKAPAQNQTSAVQQEIPSSLKGKVVQALSGGGFSYILVDTGNGQKWVTVPEVDVTVGEDVDFNMVDSQMLSKFYSKTLDRTFDTLIVASGVIGKEPKSPENQHGSMASQEGQTATSQEDAVSFEKALQKENAASPHGQEMADTSNLTGSDKAIVPPAEVHIDKATGENSYSIGELYTKAADLNGKKVKVKGQVMKVSLNIMGKNWLHLQDGSGDASKNTHDLVVTSAEVPKKGDVVTVEGVLAANKDFGFGYKYAVIVEDAVIVK